MTTFTQKHLKTVLVRNYDANLLILRTHPVREMCCLFFSCTWSCDEGASVCVCLFSAGRWSGVVLVVVEEEEEEEES